MVSGEIFDWIEPIQLSIALLVLGIIGLVVGLYVPLVELPASYTGPTDWPGFAALYFMYSPADIRYLLLIGGVLALLVVVGWRREGGAVTIVVAGYILYQKVWQAIHIAVNEPFVFDVGTYVIIAASGTLIAAGTIRLAISNSDHWSTSELPINSRVRK